MKDSWGGRVSVGKGSRWKAGRLDLGECVRYGGWKDEWGLGEGWCPEWMRMGLRDSWDGPWPLVRSGSAD